MTKERINVGLLVEGSWQDKWYDTKTTGGRFERQSSTFRDTVVATLPETADTNSGTATFLAEPNRYHLYVSLACPWAHRTLIFRKLKGLEDLVTVSVVNPYMREHGWTFEEYSGVVPDPILNARYLHQIYTHADKNYTGRVTVPVLWDKKTHTLVNNESADIIRMFNHAFDHITGNSLDFYPQELRDNIDQINTMVYDKINNGVYKAGFATDQNVYQEAVENLFEALEEIEQRLNTQRYLVGSQLTEADWRLFTTLIRFDAVYVGHFKCNLKRIADYPNLSNYLRELYQVPGVAETVNLHHIKHHYYGSHDTINPTFIVPLGPLQDFNEPHNRNRLK